MSCGRIPNENAAGDYFDRTCREGGGFARRETRTYGLEVICIVHFFGHKAVHIGRELILKRDEPQRASLKAS